MRTVPDWQDWAAGTEEGAAAPAFTPRNIHRAAVASGALPFSLPATIFLLIPALFAWVMDPGVGALAATVLLVVYGVQFVYASGAALFPLRYRLGWFAAGTLLCVAMALPLGVDALYMVMFQAMMHVMLLPWRWAVPSMILMCLTVGGVTLWLGIYTAAGLAVVGMFMSWGIGHGIRQQVLADRLAAAEQRNAVLAVAAERERIGRDLHDILGHSLTSLTISAQLARRLLDSDPEAARAQLEHIEQTIRQALADVRATSSGMQSVRAASEIASTRSVLAAVGIDAEVPSAVPPLEDERAELFGYVIREATTNIVRHSQAHRATITIDGDRVSISDDGIGIPAGAARTGLEGLERRVAAAGGHLQVDSSPAGTRVTADLSAGGTLESRSADTAATAETGAAEVGGTDSSWREARA